MTQWSLPSLLRSLSADVERNLSDARELIGHEGEKGGASEEVWRRLLRKHLPLRYQVDTGFIVDSRNNFSEQVDIVIFDRQYSPLVFELGARRIFPAESVYAVLEVKQTINLENIRYARNKVAKVRSLFRTNLPVRNLDGEDSYRPLLRILGGLVVLDSSWSPPFGNAFLEPFEKTDPEHDLDFGCVANRGWFSINKSTGLVDISEGVGTSTGFLFHLISCLQRLGTVPMIDMAKYAEHLG